MVIPHPDFPDYGFLPMYNYLIAAFVGGAILVVGLVSGLFVADLLFGLPEGSIDSIMSYQFVGIFSGIGMMFGALVFGRDPDFPKETAGPLFTLIFLSAILLGFWQSLIAPITDAHSWTVGPLALVGIFTLAMIALTYAAALRRAVLDRVRRR